MHPEAVSGRQYEVATHLGKEMTVKLDRAGTGAKRLLESRLKSRQTSTAKASLAQR